MRLYSSIIVGAKAMGYWRDIFHPSNMMKNLPEVGYVDKTAWWPDFPNLRREIDTLLPLIRNPHWTAWTAKVDPPNHVRIGTRNHKGEGYVFLVNQTTTPQAVTVTLSGLPYAASELRNVFDEKNVAFIRKNSFLVTLPEIGINSGTKVLRITSPDANN